jgi:hypothetical protein
MAEFILMLSGAMFWTAIVCVAIAWWVFNNLWDDK